jgi:hypothetical protein
MAEISDGLRDSWRLVIVFMLTILSDNAGVSSGLWFGLTALNGRNLIPPLERRTPIRPDGDCCRFEPIW